MATQVRRHHRLRRIGVFVLVSAVVLGLVGAGGAWYLSERYLGNVERVPDVFAGLDDAVRPAPAPAPEEGDPPLTFLLVGTDSTSDEPTTGDLAVPQAGASRSDVIMLLRVAGDRSSAQVISIPRDSWVDIPGRGMNKINAAYAFGGPSLLVQTVEQLTAVRVDHFATIDFVGFREMTDALGGVEVQVAEATTNQGVRFEPGLNQLDGAEALAYVRQRKGLPGGDLDRVQRQQSYLRAMLSTARQQNVLTDAGALDGFLRAFTGSVSVDEQLDNSALLGLLADVRGFDLDRVQFLTAPVAGTGMEGAQSVVYLDDARAQTMWDYLRTDELGAHTAEFEQLPATPN